ncbi:hypothetical protein Scep_010015 [Stephania cephalantha]|uniref:Uncharacterized protein n=1 Tax=Stephania cephalantha TaxID=152367 RepID=A0AAP0PEU5_9MAGN
MEGHRRCSGTTPARQRCHMDRRDSGKTARPYGPTPSPPNASPGDVAAARRTKASSGE